MDDPHFFLKSQMQTGDKTVISGLFWYACDRLGLLIKVGVVGGDFSQTGRCATVLGVRVQL